MEDNKANSFQNILLDNIDMLINISLLSTPKVLNSNSDLIVNKENAPANDSHVTKIEEYLNQQYDHVAFEERNYERGLKGT